MRLFAIILYYLYELVLLLFKVSDIYSLYNAVSFAFVIDFFGWPDCDV